MRRLALLPLLCALLAASPLQAERAHYDRAIAALRATERMWSARARAARIARDRETLAAGAANATAALAAIAHRSNLYASQDSAALAATARAQRGDGAARYRERLPLDSRAEIAQIERDARTRVAQGTAIRRQQLYERESTLALALTRRDALETMLLRVRAKDLHAGAARRHDAAMRLRAIENRDDATMNALHARDALVLAAYQTQLARAASTQTARTIARIRTRTRANLATAASAHSGPPPAAVGRAQRTLRATQRTALQQPTGTAAAYRAAHAALARRFATLAADDTAAARALDVQIVRLVRERASFSAALRAFAAQRSAGERGERRTLRPNPPP
ncbi:MAG: hypothetical protein ACREMP_02505 [Candidatus Tyrphobacter sp.]